MVVALYKVFHPFEFNAIFTLPLISDTEIKFRSLYDLFKSLSALTLRLPLTMCTTTSFIKHTYSRLRIMFPWIKWSNCHRRSYDSLPVSSILLHHLCGRSVIDCCFKIGSLIWNTRSACSHCVSIMLCTILQAIHPRFCKFCVINQ